MKIGVISDTHDRAEATTTALGLLFREGVELILHCGDIETPETVELFEDFPTHFVFGNWDRKQSELEQAIRRVGGTAHGEWGLLELAGKQVSWIHSHLRGHLRTLETSGEFDFLFYGHSHEKEMHRTGMTLVLNPGAIFRASPKSCAVVDVESGEVKWLTL
jgi:putative phosphoesterase